MNESHESRPEGWRSDELARIALFAFIVTFIAARTIVILIMSRRMPNLYLFLGTTHVHHLNYGIFLLAAAGAWLLFWQQGPRSMRIAAAVYGVAMALTFDEFGMWLHLGGSYWQRASIDAVVVVAAVLALFAFAGSIRVLTARHKIAFAIVFVAAAAFAAVLYDASVRVGHLEGEHLRQLEIESSP